MTPHRVVFDFVVHFTNGGQLSAQDFRLDIEGEAIADDVLAAHLIRDMRLLMKAKAFYAILDAGLAPAMLAHGYARLPGAASRWWLPVGDGFRGISFELERKVAWTVDGGGMFQLDAWAVFDAGEDPATFEPDLEHAIDPLASFDDTVFADIADLHARVEQKVAALSGEMLAAHYAGATAGDIAVLHAAAIGNLQARRHVTRVDAAPCLCWYDDEDVRAWSSFFATRLARMTHGIRERPVFILGEEAR